MSVLNDAHQQAENQYAAGKLPKKSAMSYAERQDLYREIEELRGRPLIVYVTSLRGGASGQMASDAIPEIIRRMEEIEPDPEVGVDLLVVSNGGDPIVAWRIATLLRERFGSYNMLAPYTAYSAATLLALGAEEIVMHPYANLGPVDPQITAQKLGGPGGPEVNQFPFADLTHYLSFVRENVGITDQRELQRAFELLCQNVTAQGVGAAKRSSQLMLALGEKLLSLRKDSDKIEARTIAESLNRAYYHHGYSLGRTEATHLKLAVKNGGEKLEALMWRVWQNLSDEMECDIPFSPGAILYSSEAAANALDTVNTVSLPTNLPPQLVQQAFQNILQQINVQAVVPVPFSILVASIEGLRGRSVFAQRGDIRGVRLPDMNVSLNVTMKVQAWERETGSLPPEARL